MPESAKRSGQAVRARRLALGLNQIEFALFANVGQSTLNQIEVHGYVPKLSLQKRIARALQMKRRDLWPDEDDELAVLSS